MTVLMRKVKENVENREIVVIFFFFFHGYGLEPRLTKNHGVVVSMRLMQFMFGVFRRNQVLTSNLLESKYPINY